MSSLDGPSPVAARPAATVVLLRPGPSGLEVLLTRRPSSMRFGANLFVFPGGRLDEGEGALEASVRETLEETGIELDPSGLAALSRWVTPPSLPIRYDTRFFGTMVDPGIDVVSPSAEVVEWRWLRPTAALEAMAANRLAMWQPTIVTLQQLESVTDEPSLRATFAPRPAERDGVTLAVAGPAIVRRFDHAWAGGIEGRTGTTAVAGEARWVVVDPGDPTGETSDRIAAAAEAAGAELAGIVVTSLEPERHAGVEMLATGLGLLVAGPRGASGLVPYAVAELADGDVVPFGDARLEALEVRTPVALPAGVAAADRWAWRAGEIRLVQGP